LRCGRADPDARRHRRCSSTQSSQDPVNRWRWAPPPASLADGEPLRHGSVSQARPQSPRGKGSPAVAASCLAGRDSPLPAPGVDLDRDREVGTGKRESVWTHYEREGRTMLWGAHPCAVGCYLSVEIDRKNGSLRSTVNSTSCSWCVFHNFDSICRKYVQYLYPQINLLKN
jgi:hypothetical protein